MAFTQGSKITASGLNSVNAGAYKSITTQSSGWKPDYKWYSHSPSGTDLCNLKISCGGFGGITINIARTDASGNPTEYMFKDATYSWFTNTTLGPVSRGPGWYRVWASENSQINAGDSWKLYYGQTDCQQGKPLTLYEDPYSGGNRCAGTKLTVSNLNSGLAGTIN